MKIKFLKVIPFANILVTILYVLVLDILKDYYITLAVMLVLYVILSGLLINKYYKQYSLLELEWSRLMTLVMTPIGFIIMFTKLIYFHNSDILGIITGLLLMVVIFVIHQFIAQK